MQAGSRMGRRQGKRSKCALHLHGMAVPMLLVAGTGLPLTPAPPCT